ncbi:hypothetical protein MGYG_06087 [Nannizzia gypsea CBS 118893]|uniref:Uncharacterized protein n=1 Tax=Arthroderma gypseum (strain ATCC MYA-4604 / CBS 118893) TaxID=535722 RepID=E4V0F5_ARTGP|nr:hypothetical protein MGYG_06087 [Nannizzia gypsea CBS 118893]EFR03092.1 hypothetical protein MGYG_06087 [Nannizzia gypsea CBS 118893]
MANFSCFPMNVTPPSFLLAFGSSRYGQPAVNLSVGIQGREKSRWHWPSVNLHVSCCLGFGGQKTTHLLRYQSARPISINTASYPLNSDHTWFLLQQSVPEAVETDPKLSQHRQQQQQALYCENPTQWNLGGKEAGSEQINTVGLHWRAFLGSLLSLSVSPASLSACFEEARCTKNPAATWVCKVNRIYPWRREHASTGFTPCRAVAVVAPISTSAH